LQRIERKEWINYFNSPIFYEKKSDENNFSRMTSRYPSGVRSKIMRINLLSSLAFGAVVFVALAESAVWAAEPVRLTGRDMDAVTAGAVAVGVGALATADSSSSYTSTSTSTTVFSTPTGTVDIGLGFGKAVACCGSSADTDVQTAYSGEGDKVIANSNVHDHHTPRFSFSHGHITVIAIDIPSH
jgi:hypothetical protein